MFVSGYFSYEVTFKKKQALILIEISDVTSDNASKAWQERESPSFLS